MNKESIIFIYRFILFIHLFFSIYLFRRRKKEEEEEEEKEEEKREGAREGERKKKMKKKKKSRRRRIEKIQRRTVLFTKRMIFSEIFRISLELFIVRGQNERREDTRGLEWSGQ